MIAAIYARKSTDPNAAADEAKSVSRQVEHARAYAARKVWAVDNASIYVDDGVSGAEFANMPGYVRLLNRLKFRPPFNVLIVSELSRLGREQLETGYAVKLLSQAGVRIVSYLEDRQIVLNTPTDKFLLAAVNFAAEIERKSTSASDRCNDTQGAPGIRMWRRLLRVSQFRSSHGQWPALACRTEDSRSGHASDPQDLSDVCGGVRLEGDHKTT